MFSIDETQNAITFTFSSSQREVERVLQEYKPFMQKLEVTELSEFNIVLRELLINAIEHGNMNMVERRVIASVEHLGKRRFKLTVEDEGKGFDYEHLDMNPPEDPRNKRRRGYALIHAFADEIQFEKQGSRVIVFVAVPMEMTIELKKEDDWVVITPSSDLTARNADKLRLLLVEQIDKGELKVRFDFRNVKVIDSISLSVLISFVKMMETKSGSARPEIAQADERVRVLFNVMRLNRIFNIKPGVANTSR